MSSSRSLATLPSSMMISAHEVQQDSRTCPSHPQRYGQAKAYFEKDIKPMLIAKLHLAGYSKVKFHVDMAASSPTLVFENHEAAGVAAKFIESHQLMRDNPVWEVGWQIPMQGETQWLPVPRTRPPPTADTVHGNPPPEESNSMPSPTDIIHPFPNGAQQAGTEIPAASYYYRYNDGYDGGSGSYQQEQPSNNTSALQLHQEPEHRGNISREHRGRRSGRY